MSITDRFDVAIERAAWRYPESQPKWLYLDADDWAEYDAAVRKDWPSAVRSFSYRDIQIRSARRSRLVTNRGCIVCIPKRISQRTQAAA